VGILPLHRRSFSTLRCDICHYTMLVKTAFWNTDPRPPCLSRGRRMQRSVGREALLSRRENRTAKGGIPTEEAP
jgi:hypothetical protein